MTKPKKAKLGIKYCHIEGRTYKDGIFGAGMIQNPPHKCDKIFLRINDVFFHLRDDEVYAIVNSLTNALWCEYQFRYHGQDTKLKWRTMEEIRKLENNGIFP